MFQIEQLKQLYKMYLEKRQQEDKVFEGLTYFLHKTPQLTKLFFSWIDLSNIEKYIFSFQMLQSFPGNKHYLYSSILKAFDLWSTIQDTQGAPGFTENSFNQEMSIEIREDIKSIVNAMNIVMQQMCNRRELDGEILAVGKVKTLEICDSKIEKLDGRGDSNSGF